MKLKYIFTLPLFFSTVACSDDSPQTPVSYTHLDVYKRQVYTLLNNMVQKYK